MTRNNSRADDSRSSEQTKDRITKTHGGQVVESIAPEEMEHFNDANCKHETLIRDDSETDYNAFMCSNPNCNEVVLFTKN